MRAKQLHFLILVGVNETNGRPWTVQIFMGPTNRLRAQTGTRAWFRVPCTTAFRRHYSAAFCLQTDS